jgi:hypothetical protein
MSEDRDQKDQIYSEMRSFLGTLAWKSIEVSLQRMIDNNDTVVDLDLNAKIDVQIAEKKGIVKTAQQILNMIRNTELINAPGQKKP